MYALKIMPHVDEVFDKRKNREWKILEQINKKIAEILENPCRFKPLRAPMQNQRRVHIGSFVLVYEVDEQAKTVLVINYKHHDEVYRGK